MAQYNVLSENINVFPTARRTQKEITARLMSEKNLVSIINKLIDKDGFVISDNTLEINDVTQKYLDTGLPIEFNIYGYYFKVTASEEIVSHFTSSTNIYAYIALDSTTYTDYEELYGQDEADSTSTEAEWRYNGLYFMDVEQPPSLTDPPANLEWHHIKIITKDSNGWLIPDESKFKFGEKSLQFEVDGGKI